jgi:hypothetical protein
MGKFTISTRNDSRRIWEGVARFHGPRRQIKRACKVGVPDSGEGTNAGALRANQMANYSTSPPNMKTRLTITGEILTVLLIFALGFLLLAL